MYYRNKTFFVYVLSAENTQKKEQWTEITYVYLTQKYIH